jgi:hypothetical protein
MALASATLTEDSGLAQAIREARLAEAAHFDAVMALRDAKTIRLKIVEEELAEVIAASPGPIQRFSPTLVPGDPPRLWIDLVTAVVMEPDPRTYRLTFDAQSGREILLETTDRAELLARLKQVIAHQIVARARTAGPAWLSPSLPAVTAEMVPGLAFIGGAVVGALVASLLFILLK